MGELNVNQISYAVSKSYEPAIQAKDVKAGDKPTTGDIKEKSAGIEGAKYDRSSGEVNDKAPYSINKKSAAERAEIVARMKAAEEDRANSLTEMVRRMISGQADSHRKAKSDLLFSGTASAEAIRKAKEDISEDGYYGVKQTSQRLFDFASALAGDDVEKMKKMQAAMNKGIGQAADKLGGLPSICRDTQDAANKLFDEYYESKGVKADEGR